MKNRILWFFTLLPSFITVIAIKYLPNQIPAHYDIAGNIDRWGSKYEKFIFPVIIILLTLHWYLYINYFKKKQSKSTDEKKINEAKQNEKIIYYVAIGMAILFTIQHVALLVSTFITVKNNLQTMAMDINIVINIAIGFLIFVSGNFMPKCKLNSVVGLRTKWSMKNSITVAKSNRFGGIVFIFTGIAIITETIILGGVLSTFLMIGIVIAAGIICTIYSYKVAKEN